MPESKKSLQGLYPFRIDILILIAASAALLWMGLHEPVLTVKQLWKRNSFSVVSGIELLRDQGHLALAAMLFFFSVIFPIAKLAGLAAIWLLRMGGKTRERGLHLLMILGKWSMLDVFVIAVVVVAVKIGLFTDAFPQKGIYLFGTSVLLSMIAAELVYHLASKHKAS